MLEKSVMQTCLLPSMLTKSMFIQQVFVMNTCSVQCLLRSKERGTDLVTISTFYACEERSSFFTSVFWCSADCSRRACSDSRVMSIAVNTSPPAKPVRKKATHAKLAEWSKANQGRCWSFFQRGFCVRQIGSLCAFAHV